jgi:integrase
LAKGNDKTLAKEIERQRKAELERAAAGLTTEEKKQRIRTVAEVIKPYLKDYKLSHQPKSILFATGRLAQVEKELGSALLSDLTESCIRDYMRKRKEDGISGRTINMEVGELSRAIGSKWTVLWPKVKKLKERKDIGKALSPSQQHKLLDGLETSKSAILRALIPTLLLTGMRPGEATGARWQQTELMTRQLTVGESKTDAGKGRVIRSMINWPAFSLSIAPGLSGTSANPSRNTMYFRSAIRFRQIYKTGHRYHFRLR